MLEQVTGRKFFAANVDLAILVRARELATVSGERLATERLEASAATDRAPVRLRVQPRGESDLPGLAACERSFGACRRGAGALQAVRAAPERPD